MKNDTLNKDDLKELNFAELALYIESLNEIEEEMKEDSDTNE